MSQVTRPEYQPIEGSYNEKTKEFKVEDKKIQNVAKGNWGKFLHWIGYSSKLMISSEGQVRDIYVPKYIAQKFIQDERISKLKGFELLRSKIGDVFAKALGSPPHRKRCFSCSTGRYWIKHGRSEKTDSYNSTR